MTDAQQTARAAGLPYTDLQGFSADRRMFHYVPLRVALERRILPVTVVGDRLQIASATPDPDLETLHRHFPALDIDVVIAPGHEIDRVLAAAEEAAA